MRPDDCVSAFPILIYTRDSFSTGKRRVKRGAIRIDVLMAAARRKEIEDARAIGDVRR